MFARLLPWAVRAAWATLPVVSGGLVGDATAGWEPSSTRAVVAMAAWAAWGGVMLATLVAHPLALTVVRVGAPAAVVAAGAAAVGAPDPSTVEVVLGVGGPVIAAALAALPEIGAYFVNGPAYPNERRLPLRTPGPLLLAPLPLAWAVAAGAPAAAVLLIADRRWVPGGIAAAVGLPLAGLCWRALYGLARRWVVFVPAGLVLHDPMTLVDPVLFPRQIIESLHAAPAGTDSLDLTMNAPGLALELALTEKVPMLLSRGRKEPEAGSSARLLFTPTRPGAVLTEARVRRIPMRR